MVSPVQRPIVFFDGVCSLCNAAVDFLIRRDHAKVLLFAPLQGQAAAIHLHVLPNTTPDTIVLVDAQGRWERSDAALRIAGYLGWPWKGLIVLRIIPRPVRDVVYRWIARNRYRWFGQKESCRMPTPEERARFLP
jgi:predicted DCC family thiol-disulfide oxidoreductase YuxK